MDFDTAFHTLLGHEGGFVDHPSDPGGATRWGVTQRVARDNGYTGDMREYPQHLAMDVYRRLYWDAVRADELPGPVRYAVFDAAVNSGATQAVRWLQSAVGVADDGQLGPVTLAAVRKADPQRTLRLMVAARLDFMTRLQHWREFGRGWSRRLAAVLKG